MTEEQNQRKQDLVDSLLQSLYKTDQEQSRSLVSSGMERLEQLEIRQAEMTAGGSIVRPPRWLVIGLATAAMLCIAIFIPLFDNSRSAMAAVTLSLDQARQDIGRHYLVHSRWRAQNGNSNAMKVDLFVKGGEQFALKIPNPIQPNMSVWVGSNQDQAWVVPPFGPVLEGNRRNLSEWFDRRKDASTPYLHITTALELMSELYELESLPDETVDRDGDAIWCHRVTGRLKGEPSTESPDHINLWANAESGVAVKIIATWDLVEGRSGRESVTILLQEEIDLADDFFTPETHGASERSRLDFFSEDQAGRKTR